MYKDNKNSTTLSVAALLLSIIAVIIRFYR